METYAIVLGFFFTNIIWMIFFQSQKDGKDFITEVKQIMPHIPTFKRKEKFTDVSTASPQDANKILKNLIQK